MPRSHPKTKKKLFIAGCVAVTTAALGAGTAVSASASSTISVTRATLEEARSAGLNQADQCINNGSTRADIIDSHRNADGSWTVTVLCE